MHIYKSIISTCDLCIIYEENSCIWKRLFQGYKWKTGAEAAFGVHEAQQSSEACISAVDLSGLYSHRHLQTHKILGQCVRSLCGRY